MISRALLYARTLRHLRPAQWAYLPLRRVQSRLPLPRTGAGRTAAPARVAPLAAEMVAQGPGSGADRVAVAGAVGEGRFRFLGREERLGTLPPWADRVGSHLWSYHLHYFDYAVDLAWAWRLTGDPAHPRRFAALARSWIEDTAGGRGDGWEPYALSTRVLNWMRALLLFGEGVDGATRDAVECSLWCQLAVLERRTERHLGANHLQRNLQALAVGGLLFDGGEAERWRRTGARGLWRELDEQVLADGGHFERSPMYHAIALGDLLETVTLLRAAGASVPDAAIEAARRMAAALGVLSRPDGRLHLFNDAADGAAPARRDIDALARRVTGAGVPAPDGLLSLPASGYHGWCDGATRLLADFGAPAPAHQPAHAHCGLLGFELDLGGHPVAVDAGVSGYAGDPFREYARSTRAHNTVTVGNREQSEVWGTFRMARRALALEPSVQGDARGAVLEGSAVPYHDRGAVHRRRIEVRGGELRVEDRVEGAPGAPLASHLHFHPTFSLARSGERWIATRPGQAVVVECGGADEVEVVRGARDPVQGWHLPSFGTALPAAALILRVRRNDGRAFGYRLRDIGTDG